MTLGKERFLSVVMHKGLFEQESSPLYSIKPWTEYFVHKSFWNVPSFGGFNKEHLLDVPTSAEKSANFVASIWTQNSIQTSLRNTLRIARIVLHSRPCDPVVSWVQLYQCRKRNVRSKELFRFEMQRRRSQDSNRDIYCTKNPAFWKVVMLSRIVSFGCLCRTYFFSHQHICQCGVFLTFVLKAGRQFLVEPRVCSLVSLRRAREKISHQIHCKNRWLDSVGSTSVSCWGQQWTVNVDVDKLGARRSLVTMKFEELCVTRF